MLGLYAQVRPVSLPGSRYPTSIWWSSRETTEENTRASSIASSRSRRGIGRDRGRVQPYRPLAERAARMGRKKITAVHKANIMKLSDGLFLECVRAVAKEHPEIAFEEMIVDNTAMRLVSDPYRFDLLVMESFYGDLVAELITGLAGGMSASRSALYGDGIAVFEAVQGEAPDLVGKNLANPLPLLGSAVMMLQHLGESEAAARIERAIAKVLTEKRALTRDLGGSARTVEMATAIASALG
jgi:isocitrate dehydrogenase (NAD+)